MALERPRGRFRGRENLRPRARACRPGASGEAIIDCQVQAIRIGGLGIANQRGGVFLRARHDIKAASPFLKTWVRQPGQRLGRLRAHSFPRIIAGGYEPRTARSARLAPRAGQALVEGRWPR